MFRFTPPTVGYSLFLLDKRVSRRDDRDEPDAPVPCWRTPQPKPHAHEDHEINLVVGGNARWRWGDGQETLVTMGEIFLVPAGVMHIVEVDDHVVTRGLWIHLNQFRGLARSAPENRELISRLLQTASPPPARRLRDPGLYRTANEIFEQSQAEYARNDVWRDDCLRSLGQLAACCFVRMLHTPPQIHPGHPTEQRVLNVRAWMDRNYLEDATLPALADRASLSVSQFSDIFRRLCGVSPKAYLIQRRMNRAAALLSTTDLTITEIALTTGIHHLSSFNALFKRHLHLTPGEYRKKHKKDTQNPEDNARGAAS